jgi:hypothetical protein
MKLARLVLWVFRHWYSFSFLVTNALTEIYFLESAFHDAKVCFSINFVAYIFHNMNVEYFIVLKE